MTTMFDCGEYALLDGDIKVRILDIKIFGGEYTEYTVTWWVDGKPYEHSVAEWRLIKCPVR